MPKTHIFERELWGDGLWETANVATGAIKTDWGLITVLHSVRAHLKRCNLKAHCSLLPSVVWERKTAGVWSIWNHLFVFYYGIVYKIPWNTKQWKRSPHSELLQSDQAAIGKIGLELMEHSLLFAFCNSPEVGSLHFVTLAFPKRTSYFLTRFLMLFIFCPAKLHYCMHVLQYRISINQEVD